MMNEELLQYIYHGKEERNLEYKETMSWEDNATHEKVLKCVLAMANLYDGGILVFGVSDTGNRIGMQSSHFESFSQDEVTDFVNKYASPHVEISVNKVTDVKETDEHGSSKKYVVIQVAGFSDIPIICAKGGVNWKAGEVYTRPKRKIESVPVKSEGEMREIISKAVDINLQKYLRIAKIVKSIDENPMHNYQEQMDDFDNAGDGKVILENIHKQGFWRVQIIPLEYLKHRLPKIKICREIIEQNRVYLRGWDYPHVSSDAIHTVENGICGFHTATDHHEYWRFYTSGLFLHEFTFWEDSTRPNQRTFSFLNTLYTVTEIFEFSARLAQSDYFNCSLSIRISLDDMQDRHILDPDRLIFDGYTSFVPKINLENDYAKNELVSNQRRIAIEVTKNILESFNWLDISDMLLQEDQRKFLERRVR